MKVLSRAFKQSPAGLPLWATLDQEALRLSSALDHIARHGNLDDFPESRSEKLALMTTASRRGLVTWNRDGSRYELTSLGRQQIGQHQACLSRSTAPASRGFVLARPASPFSPGALIASAACTVLGVFFIAVTLSSFEHAPKNAVPRVADNSTPHQDHHPAAEIQHSNPADQPHTPATGPQDSTRKPTAPPVQTGTTESRSHTEGAQTAPSASEPTSEGTAVHTTNARTYVARAKRTQNTAASKHVGNEPEKRHGNTRVSDKGPSVASVLAREKGKARGVSPGAPEPQHRWDSGKKINVARSGLLVREERKLADGTVLVRYQFGNGPAHFEKRPSADRARNPGYAYISEHSPRFGWLDRLIR
jgi:hypothetical protein